MASYRAIGTATTAELSDGTVLGSNIHTAASLNGKSLKKGSGAVLLKEVAESGESFQGGKQYAFKYGETITVA